MAEKLKSRYGVGVGKPQRNPADVRLDFVKDGIKPEGFILDVDASGVHLQASSSRGMYYAVRALLDITRQSSFAKPEADPKRARQWLYAGDPPHPFLDELERLGPPAVDSDD